MEFEMNQLVWRITQTYFKVKDTYKIGKRWSKLFQMLVVQRLTKTILP